MGVSKIIRTIVHGCLLGLPWMETTVYVLEHVLLLQVSVLFNEASVPLSEPYYRPCAHLHV